MRSERDSESEESARDKTVSLACSRNCAEMDAVTSDERLRADAPDARRTSAHAAPVPQTSDKKPCANCGGRPCDGVEFERFASSGKRHKTCTTCKADRTVRKAASQLRLLVNPKS